MDKELFLAGFDLNEDSSPAVSEAFNATLGANLTGKVHTVELMGVPCGKECYAISVASCLTFLAGVYQVEQLDPSGGAGNRSSLSSWSLLRAAFSSRLLSRSSWPFSAWASSPFSFRRPCWTDLPPERPSPS